MPDEDSGRALLEGAYRLATPDDSRAYYAGEAARYDTDFIAALGYVYPAAVARVWRAHATPEDLPIADIGCGTGAVAEALALQDGDIDGFDISPEMLAVAGAKRRYRHLLACDLTAPLDALPSGYGSILSSGTFTHGHLGPGPLGALLGLARPGGLFVIGVNAAHHAAAGFGPALAALTSAGRIGPVTATEVPIYDRQGHAHSADRALILTWRRA